MEVALHKQKEEEAQKELEAEARFQELQDRRKLVEQKKVKAKELAHQGDEAKVRELEKKVVLKAKQEEKAAAKEVEEAEKAAEEKKKEAKKAMEARRAKTKPPAKALKPQCLEQSSDAI